MRRRLVLASSSNPTARGDNTVHNTSLREKVLETEGHATGSLPRSDPGALASPAEPVIEDIGDELENSSGGEEEEPMRSRVASLEPVVPMMGPVRAALKGLDHVDLTVEFARRACPFSSLDRSGTLSGWRCRKPLRDVTLKTS